MQSSVVAVGKIADELVGAREPARLNAFLLGGVFVAPAEVVEDSAREQHVLLEHNAYLVAQDLQIVAPDVLSADLYAALADVVKPSYEVDKTGRSLFSE